MQKPLFLKSWEPGPIEQLTFQKFPIWIKRWNVPLQLLAAEGISRIASAL